MLTRTEIDFFRDQGYLRIPNWLDAAEVERLKALADAELARARDERTRGAWDLMEAAAPAVFRLSRIASRHEAFRAAALDARGCAAARQLLGEDAVWCVNRHNMMVVKAPRVARPINWHQDGVNWDHPNMLSLMVFLESADAENGCLQVVPGAHKLGLLPPRAGTGDMDLDDPAQAALARQAVPVCAAPGDALFFHCALPHHSGPNRSERGRRNLVFAYVRERERASGASKMQPIEFERLPETVGV